jgi:formylmethanofuran dehydrogenase subunit B
LAKVGGFHQVEKVEDIMKIMEYNVVSTPAIVIDGVLKSSGKLLTVEEIIELINSANNE